MVPAPCHDSTIARQMLPGLLASVFQHIDSANDCLFWRARLNLLGRECIVLAGVCNHLTHFADAFGALGCALVPREDVAGLGRAGLDREGDVTLAKTIAVADVHDRGVLEQT